MGPRYRAMVQPYAKLITTLQISQMFVGLLVNGAIIYYTSIGARPRVAGPPPADSPRGPSACKGWLRAGAGAEGRSRHASAPPRAPLRLPSGAQARSAAGAKRTRS